MITAYSNNPTFKPTFPSHCEEHFGRIRKVNEIGNTFTGNERRGNLFSIFNWQELFIDTQKPFHHKVRARRLLRGCSSDFLHLRLTHLNGGSQ
jgi:hypothetical protein